MKKGVCVSAKTQLNISETPITTTKDDNNSPVMGDLSSVCNNRMHGCDDVASGLEFQVYSQGVYAGVCVSAKTQLNISETPITTTKDDNNSPVICGE